MLEVDATKELGGVKTSSSLPMPRECIAATKASVPLFIATQCFEPQKLEAFFSNFSIIEIYLYDS